MGGEYYLVKWLPRHKDAVKEETLKPVPYKNDRMGIEMQVASGLMGSVEEFPGGVRITRPKFWSIGPSITITSQPNPDGTFEFDPKVAAKWQTDGLYQEIPRYHFSRTKIHNRDAVIIWEFKNRAMMMTARILSSERLIEIHCTPGKEDEELYMQACEETVQTVNVAGPEPPPPTQTLPPVDLTTPQAKRRGKT